jgi:hypothetical protein
VFDGAISVIQAGQTEPQLFQVGQGIFVSPAGARPVATPPTMQGPRPDTIEIPTNFFSSANTPEGQDGLVVHVRDGHVELISDGQVLHLGAGETGMQSAAGLVRPEFTPLIIIFDNIPLPNTRNISLQSLLPSRAANVPLCRRL